MALRLTPYPLVVVLGLGCALHGADPVADAPVPTATADWYCVGYDASHSYTSPDILPPPLKLRWSWAPPAGEQATVLQAVSSNGKVMVHGRHGNSTPVGTRNGCHNWVLDLETGTCDKEDPESTTFNDWVVGYAIGSADGHIYQCDDGGPPYGGGDVWGTIQLSPSQGWWAVIQENKIDGPDPGIYCMPMGQGIGSGWYAGTKASGNSHFCQGNVSIGSGVLYTTTQWTLQAPDLVNGLSSYELTTGKRRWKLDGHFMAVTAGKDWCVAVDDRKVMVVVAAEDGKIITTQDLSSLPECPPMVVDNAISLYDTQGNLTRYLLSEKAGKRTLKKAGQTSLGPFSGPRVAGAYNAPFCFTADGTLYVANGSSVAGISGGKKGHSWSWNVPSGMAHDLGALGHPIIARGKLIVVGAGGVLCFDKQGAAKAEKGKP